MKPETPDHNVGERMTRISLDAVREVGGIEKKPATIQPAAQSSRPDTSSHVDWVVWADRSARLPCPQALIRIRHRLLSIRLALNEIA
jgi:hypothetical protein